MTSPGRPRRQSVDYFPHDADASDRKTLTILTRKFGNDGYAAWFRLLELLARSENHFYDCNQLDDFQYLASKLNVAEDSATEIMEQLVVSGAIDGELWENKIIWSQNFVDRLTEVYRKRGRELPQKPNICDRKPKAPSISATEKTQSRVEESEPKESKEDTLGNRVVAQRVFEWYKFNHGKLPGVKTLTPGRIKKINTRITNFGGNGIEWEQSFEQAVVKARNTPFMTGNSKGGWRADFDWFIRADENIEKTLEGKYDGKKKPQLLDEGELPPNYERDYQ